jgi:hypothetical protein
LANTADTEYSEVISYYTDSPGSWAPQLAWSSTGTTSLAFQYTTIS